MAYSGGIFEVFCELSAFKVWGRAGKWIVIVSIQVFKCIARLLLIYRYKESIVQSPPVPALDRKTIKSNTTNGDFNQTATFTLKRSGRVVRKVEASPPIGLRRWTPLENEIHENKENMEQVATSRQLMAETIYISKPIVHLASLACFGSTTWKPWLISLAVDLTSLHIYRSDNASTTRSLTPLQRIQVSKRIVALLLYLLRSPFYDRYSKDKINAILIALSNHVPLVGHICNPLQQYLPFWQSTYFYMWST
ncbi:hypothetical protein NQ317_001415 [Molorchus minor]|uniref:Peroxisomal membrane protein PEX16 n=1 Tax=Molorchus minor TaxID=1323400 RepID=A0ABQ9JXB5_9CUCU|nr:hypothetical protein NQ317_001415 [Molorchus minor]